VTSRPHRLALFGANGGLGRAVLEYIRTNSTSEVVGITRTKTTDCSGLHHVGSYNGSDAALLVATCDGVIDCAWGFALSDRDSQVEALASRAEMCIAGGVRRYVFPSSVAVYLKAEMDSLRMYTENEVVDASENPSLYGAEKVRCEDLLRDAEVEQVAVRLAPVALPQQNYTARLFSRGVLAATVDPTSRFQLLTPSDAASFLLDAAIVDHLPTDTVNLAPDDSVTLSQVAERFPSARARPNARGGPVAFPLVDTAVLRDRWGFVPRFTSRWSLDNWNNDVRT
jgi:nucleoside-diphosphate-sugar epimerase